jgi:hypothetical protein
VAFEMAVERITCPGQQAACFEATIRNVGHKPGSGSCWLEGFSDGDENHVRQRSFKVELGPGDVRKVFLAWKKAPLPNYTGGCDPAPVA